MGKKKIFPDIAKIIISILMISCISLASALAIPEIKAEVDKAVVNIGDIIHYAVSFKVPAAAQLRLPPGQDSKMIGSFNVRSLDEKKVIIQDKAEQIIRNYELTIFQVGEYIIPEYSLEYRLSDTADWQKITAPSIKINVESVLEKDAQQLEIKPIKPRRIIWRDFWGWVIGLIILILIAVIIFFVKKYRAKLKTKPVVIIPAHLIALEELKKIQEQNLIGKGLIEQYFEKLSGCMRHYLENRFHLRAPWLSTEEFLSKAKTSPVLTTEHKHLLQNFLILCDMVKFACYESSANEAEDSFALVSNFVEQTKFVAEDVNLEGKQ